MNINPQSIMTGEYSSTNGLLPYMNNCKNMLKDLFSNSMQAYADTLGMKVY
jgi:hypothetical protein